MSIGGLWGRKLSEMFGRELRLIATHVFLLCNVMLWHRKWLLEGYWSLCDKLSTSPKLGKDIIDWRIMRYLSVPIDVTIWISLVPNARFSIEYFGDNGFVLWNKRLNAKICRCYDYEVNQRYFGFRNQYRENRSMIMQFGRWIWLSFDDSWTPYFSGVSFSRVLWHCLLSPLFHHKHSCFIRWACQFYR